MPERPVSTGNWTIVLEDCDCQLLTAGGEQEGEGGRTLDKGRGNKGRERGGGGAGRAIVEGEILEGRKFGVFNGNIKIITLYCEMFRGIDSYSNIKGTKADTEIKR